MVRIRLLLVSFIFLFSSLAYSQNDPAQVGDVEELQKIYEQMQGQLGQLTGQQPSHLKGQPVDPNAPGIEIDTTKMTELLNSLKDGGPNKLQGMLQGVQNTKNKAAPILKKGYGLVSDDRIRGAYANLNKDWSWKEMVGWQIAAIVFIYILKHWLHSRSKLWVIKLAHSMWTSLLLFFLSSFVVPRIVYGPAFTELVIRAWQILTGSGGGSA